MYKETISDSAAYTLLSSKQDAASDYQPGTSWNMTLSNNQRTSGENTPLFHKKKRAGELLPFTRFLQVENKHRISECLIEVERLSDGQREKYSGTGLAYESDGDLVSFEAAAGLGEEKTSQGSIMQGAASKTQGDWDVLTFAAEMGETVGMFTGLLTKVTRLIRLKPPEMPWNTWLELRYGWRTLAFEMQDIEEAFSKTTGRKFSRASAGQSVSWVTETSGSLTLTEFTQLFHSKTEYKMNSRGRIVVVGDLPRFRVDIIKTAWEVTRLSFVLDWFLNIGNWIDSVQFVVGERAYTAGFGSQIEITYHGWRNFIPSPGYVMLESKASVYKTALIQRRGPASIPLIPLFSLNLNRWKIVDLLALLVQATWRK